MAVLAGSGRRRVTLVAAVCAAVALAGCGGQAWSSSAFGTSPTQAVLDSVRTTTAAGTARVAMKMVMTGLPGGAGALEVDITGALDLRGENAQLQMSGSGSAASIFGGLEARLVNGVSYVRFPSIPGLPAEYAGKWVRVDLGRVAGGPSAFGQSGDPGAFLGSLAAVSGGVQRVGTGTVRGVATTRYHAVLDLTKIMGAGRVPAALRPQLRAMASAFGSTTLPIDAWVDAHGYLRRLTTAVDLSSLYARDGHPGLHPTMTMTMDLYDFGVPVHVVAPPPDEVISLPTQFPGAPS